MGKNELGCFIWADSCIVTKDGTKYYVDNSEENIRDQMDSGKEIIEVELAKVISDRITKVSIKKEEIEEVYSVKNK